MNKVTKVGTPNIKLNRDELIVRAKVVGFTENQLEELTTEELNHLVTLKELKDY